MAERVLAPDGSAWTVRRRWWPWRRVLSLRAIWYSTGEDDKPSGGDDEALSTESVQPESSSNPVVHAILVVLAAVIWLVAQAGKAALIVLAAVIVMLLALIDFVLQVLVMPLVLLARTCGVMSWPVQIDREKRYFRTEHVRGFGAAAALCDELEAQIQRGALQPNPTPPA
ncbi:hypothetical protein MSIMFB_02804 [Mycobacterium simulans]|uniref:Uncharacterized protein n=1 Tax=Mycobacterium simulans TaxID=627089 RepID=A0A7Z7IKM5_9MYCO|nr:hypothetical protein [Mycobacterium simulans]SOJ55315.1 hypothetical protein MSIMFB_02804 [Mycobacterium simulans]